MQKELDERDEELLARIRRVRTDRPDSDAELSDQVRIGRTALEELLRRNVDWLSRLCAFEAKTPEMASDALQEALIEIAKSLPSFEGRSALRTWMFTIARRAARRMRWRETQQAVRFPLGRSDDYASGASGSTRLESSRLESSRAGPIGIEGEAKSPTPESRSPLTATAVEAPNALQLLESSEEQKALLVAVRQLPEKQRLAVMLHYFEDLSVEQVATNMKCTTGTVKTHLFRARDRLKRILTEDATLGTDANLDEKG